MTVSGKVRKVELREEGAKVVQAQAHAQAHAQGAG